VLGIANALEHLTDTDARNLGVALDVPAQWLRDGWG
jgi:hypothetical protein